jgi:hypothetical protein
VVDGDALATSMVAHATVLTGHGGKDSGYDVDSWVVNAESEGLAQDTWLVGGTRRALAMPVALSPQAMSDALVVEATEHGWLALLPTGRTTGTLFGFVPAEAGCSNDPVDEMVSMTRAIRGSIDAITGPTAIFPAAARLRCPPDDGRACLHAGRAAMSFDPLSGDGAAVAMRMGHLAASLVDASARGVSPERLRSHYRSRLARSMCAHLDALLALYVASPFRDRWHGELEAMRTMAAEIRSTYGEAVPDGFSLSEWGLEPRLSAHS